VVSPLSGPVLRLPLVASVPVHPPEALQELALLDDHESVTDPFTATVVLDASSAAAVRAVTGVVPPHADTRPAAATTQKHGRIFISSLNSCSWILFFDPSASPVRALQEFAYICPTCSLVPFPRPASVMSPARDADHTLT
jgi:hypothetical protein